MFLAYQLLHEAMFTSAPTKHCHTGSRLSHELYIKNVDINIIALYKILLLIILRCKKNTIQNIYEN